VLDIDVEHDAARLWWQANHAHLPLTRTFRSRSGGLHLYFIHTPGVRNTQSKLCQGLDTRGEGGYIIYWFAAGTDCLDHSPLVAWPQWLLVQLLRKSRPLVPAARQPLTRNPDSAIQAVLHRIEAAPEGQRNSMLFWGACRLGERVGLRQIGDREAEQLLVAAAVANGLTEREAHATVHSGLRMGVQYVRR
jgi:hypothetical protein